MKPPFLARQTDRLRESAPLTGRSKSSVRVYLLLECGGGGSGRHVLDLYAGLVAAGWDVHLLLSSMRMDAGFAQEVAALPQDHVTFLRLRRSPHISDLSEIRRIRKQMRREGGSIVLHAHSTKAAMVACALRGPSACRVFTPHAYRGMDPKLSGYRAKVIRTAERLFSKPFESVIAVSQDEVGYAEGLGVRSARIHLIPNGVNASGIRSGTGERRSQGAAEPCVLGFLGRLAEQKNPSLFLRVVAEVVRRGRNVQALVVGDGPLLPELKLLAQALHLEERIQWMGMVPAVSVLGKMDVLVHTSAYESLPYALLEAVAADLPVVSVPNAGSKAVFGDLFPLSIVPSHTAEALADAVCTLAGDQALRMAYSKAYQEIAERFSTGGMVQKTIAVYEHSLRAGTEKRVSGIAARRLPRFGLPVGPAALLRRAFHGSVRTLGDPAATEQATAWEASGASAQP